MDLVPANLGPIDLNKMLRTFVGVHLFILKKIFDVCHITLTRNSCSKVLISEPSFLIGIYILTARCSLLGVRHVKGMEIYATI